MANNIPYSSACERNQGAIFEVIKSHLQQAKTVLEIGSGSAQHAVYFAQQCPNLCWQTSDQMDYLPGINAQLSNAQLANVRAPIQLNVNSESWLSDSQKQSFDIIYTANTLHIMDWASVEAFFGGIGQVMHGNTKLVVYGPFKYRGEFTSQSNNAFDALLRSRGVGSAIRDFEAVNQLAQAQGLALLDDAAMPANNQCLVWQQGII